MLRAVEVATTTKRTRPETTAEGDVQAEAKRPEQGVEITRKELGLEWTDSEKRTTKEKRQFSASTAQADHTHQRYALGAWRAWRRGARLVETGLCVTD